MDERTEKLFRFEDYKGNYAMYCMSKQEEKEFCELMDKNGFTWWDKKSYLEDSSWKDDIEDICYNFNNGTCSPRQFYENEGYTILKWSDFSKGIKNMNNRTIENKQVYRLCTVNDKRAIFHRWIDHSDVIDASFMIGGHLGGIVKFITGLVEFEDGTVKEVKPTAITFTDAKCIGLHSCTNKN